MKTAQRVSAVDASDNFVLARSVLAYERAARIVGSWGGSASGDGGSSDGGGSCAKPDVLEIGTGTGYGVDILSPVCRSLTTVDKFQSDACRSGNETSGNPSFSETRSAPLGAEGAENVLCCVVWALRQGREACGERPGDGLARKSQPTKHTECALDNVTFRQMRVPPLDFPDASFDFVVAFQVIEHIRRDGEFLAEIQRVLRPGGRLIVTTPNREMSLTRNPWHVREYTADEFGGLVGRYFGRVEALGVFGDGRAMEYYERNREGVARVARWDVLRLREWLPRWFLRVPYDVANRLNRRRLLAENGELTRALRPENYFLAPIARATDGSVQAEGAFDLFYVCGKC